MYLRGLQKLVFRVKADALYGSGEPGQPSPYMHTSGELTIEEEPQQ